MRLLLCMMSGAALLHAATIDCRKATDPDEKLICGRPVLRQLDTRMSDLYERLRVAIEPRLEDPLTETQRRWLAARRDCARKPPPASMAACIESAYRKRIDLFTALLAGGAGVRIGTLEALVMVGVWQAGRPEVPSHPGEPVPPAAFPTVLPEPGTKLIFRPGQICVPNASGSERCDAFGLETSTLGATVAGRRHMRELNLPAETPFAVGYRNGRADFSLIFPLDKRILAAFLACKTPVDPNCDRAYQPWVPTTPDARYETLK
jgi:uncharacterized protein YecT (DUF1311 family)